MSWDLLRGERDQWPVCPDLAARLERLNDRQFRRLWEEVRRRAGRKG